MIDMILKWLYQNSAAIIISSLISLLISMMYYRKGNRDELLMSVIFPVVQLLNKSYSRKNYDELLSIKSNYAIRYLGKKERRTLMLLIEQYSIVCQYNRSKKDTDCILSYFDFKLGEIGINPKPCPITDDEGETVAYDYPVFCKPFLHKIAKSFCRLLHLHFVGNCKTTAGSYSASHKPLQIIFSCYNTRYGNGSSEFSSSCACSLK